jgi:hypothetical protein
MKLHIYSDLRLRYLEFSDPVDELVPDVDAVIVAGNISTDAKRSLLFQETLGQHNKPVFLNYGLLEFTRGSYCLETLNSTQLRYGVKKDTNCYYKHNGNTILPELKLDVLPLFGWPKFNSQEELDNTKLGKILLEVVWGMYYDEEGVAINAYDPYPTRWNRINELHEQEQSVLADWLADQHTTDNTKVLVVGHNYAEIIKADLTNVILVVPGEEAQDTAFNNGRLYSNPGRGSLPRSRILTV